MAETIAIGSAVLSGLLAVILGLAQMHWRSTLSTLDERFTYERAKLDRIVLESNHQALQLATYAASNNAMGDRLESIEVDLSALRKELINISQACVRIETQIRRSTPPPKGG